MKKPEPLFLIIAGAITALFLPFALAFPPTLLGKELALEEVYHLRCPQELHGLLR